MVGLGGQAGSGAGIGGQAGNGSGQGRDPGVCGAWGLVGRGSGQVGDGAGWRRDPRGWGWVGKGSGRQAGDGAGQRREGIRGVWGSGWGWLGSPHHAPLSPPPAPLTLYLPALYPRSSSLWPNLQLANFQRGETFPVPGHASCSVSKRLIF